MPFTAYGFERILSGDFKGQLLGLAFLYRIKPLATCLRATSRFSRASASETRKRYQLSFVVEAIAKAPAFAAIRVDE
jgi:hypothetical protein